MEWGVECDTFGAHECRDPGRRRRRRDDRHGARWLPEHHTVAALVRGRSRARRHPTAHRRQPRPQAVLHALLAIWAISGAVLILANPRAGLGPALLLVIAVSFGCTSSVSTSLLFTQRIVRPIVAAASTEFTSRETAPGVVARLVMMWLVNSALPSLAIALLVVFHANGWFIPRSASLVIPVVVLTTVSVALSLRALILVSRSISDPLNDVVEAMAEVEHGQIGKTVDVYEQSEIGRLQHGFNRMVAGLTERDRLRDLFGRHVGPDVARLAVEADESLSGEVRDVAVLFIDLAGSTQLPASRLPRRSPTSSTTSSGSSSPRSTSTAA